MSSPGNHHSLVSPCIDSRCSRCSLLMPRFTSLDSSVSRSLTTLLLVFITQIFRFGFLRYGSFSGYGSLLLPVPGDCPDTVRQRESRQLTAAGQSQTLTRECQSETRPETGRRAAAAGQLDNLNSLLVKIHLQSAYGNFTILQTITVLEDIFLTLVRFPYFATLASGRGGGGETHSFRN